MTIATDLRTIREYIAEHGFSTHIGCHDDARCFVGAGASVGVIPTAWDRMPTMLYLRSFIGPHDSFAFASHRLKRDGWTKRDALALLDIAADCAEAEGR